MSENYVKFHEDAEKINSNFEDLELLLKNAKTESDNQPIEEKWQKIQQMYQDLLISGKQFIKLAKEVWIIIIISSGFYFYLLYF